MATITASSVSTTDSLETFRQQFNTLRGDIQGLSFGASVVFEGATADDFETTLAVTDPTADRTVTIQDKTGVLAMQGRDINDIVVMNASDGSGTDEADAILLNASESGVDEGEALLYEDGTGDHIVNPVLQIGGNFVFEGATANEFETTLSITDPTADRTVTIQDKTGTVALLGRDIDDIIVLNGTDASGTDESSSIILDGDATSVAGVVVNVGEALLYEEGTNDHIVNPTFEEYEEFIILEESTENALVFLTRENTDESSVNARFAYQAATSDNLLGSLFLPPAAGGAQFIMPVSDGNANQVFSTDGAGNLQFVNLSSGLSLNNDANNRVITATGSNTGNGEANLTFDGSTLTVTGDATVDDINLNGKVVTITGDTDDTFTITTGAAGATTLATTDTAATAGDITLDADGDIKLDAADNGAVLLHNSGTKYGSFFATSDNLNIKSDINNKDIVFRGLDDSSDITALTLDMSEAGIALFNSFLKSPSFFWSNTDNGQVLRFGGSAEIQVHHVHDTGLTFTNTIADTDNRPFVLQLKSEEDAIVADDVIASIEMAAGDSDGTDGATVAAGIHAIAEGTFSASANATKLVFTTGVSETAASSATAKMSLSSGGNLTLPTDAAVLNFGADSEIALTHNHNVGLKMTSTAYAPLARRGEDVFIVLDQTAAGGTDAGDNVIMDRSAADGTDAGDDIIGEDEVFLHSGMQRNVLQIFNSGGRLLNSVAGFAPGAI